MACLSAAREPRPCRGVVQEINIAALALRAGQQQARLLAVAGDGQAQRIRRTGAGQFAGVFVGLGGLCPRGGIVVDGAGDVPDISQHVRRPHAACDRLRGRQRQDGLEASLRPRQPLFAELARFALCQQVVHRAGGIQARGFRDASAGGVGRVAVCLRAHLADGVALSRVQFWIVVFRYVCLRRLIVRIGIAGPQRVGGWRQPRRLVAERVGRRGVQRAAAVVQQLRGEVGAAGNDHAGADEAGKQERLCEFLRVGHGGWSVRVHSVSSRCCVGRRRAAGLPARDAGRCLVRRVPACSR